ncbi:hypothetical protein [Thalassobacillus sp. C254]|uniref:hypothetical protein n=1 Tax=Thalassobacillus sp. C254 TaxID=1225341 RepID=UPI0006D0A33B|nr:hypothetical protein [Thalassobacillus sp. C254]
MGCLQMDQPFEQESNEEDVQEASARNEKTEYSHEGMETNNQEYLELANDIRKKAMDRQDVELVKQIDNDIKFLLSLRKEDNEK